MLIYATCYLVKCNQVPVTVDQQVIKVVSLARKEALLLRIGGNGKRLDLAAKLSLIIAWIL